MYCTVHAVASRHDEKAVPSRPIRRQQTAFAGFFLFSFPFSFFFLFSLPLSSYPVMKKWRATACR